MSDQEKELSWPEEGGAELHQHLPKATAANRSWTKDKADDREDGQQQHINHGQQRQQQERSMMVLFNTGGDDADQQKKQGRGGVDSEEKGKDDVADR